MITGEFPDANRSYELCRQIPGFNETLEDMVERLETLAQRIDEMSGERSGNLVASINNMRRVMNIMLENPYTAHQYKSDYYSNYSTISSWLYEMTSMPLGIDALYLQSPGTQGTARPTTDVDKSQVRYPLRTFLPAPRTASRNPGGVCTPGYPAASGEPSAGTADRRCLWRTR